MTAGIVARNEFNCKSAARDVIESAALQPGEYIASRLTAGDVEGAQIATTLQYNAGFNAQMRDTDYQDFRPTAWQRGWLDAYALSDISPALQIRLGA